MNISVVNFAPKPLGAEIPFNFKDFTILGQEKTQTFQQNLNNFST